MQTLPAQPFGHKDTTQAADLASARALMMAASTMTCTYCGGHKEATYDQADVHPGTHCTCPQSAVWRLFTRGCPPAMQRELARAAIRWDPTIGDSRTNRGRERRRQGQEIRLVIDGQVLALDPRGWREWMTSHWEQWEQMARAQ